MNFNAFALLIFLIFLSCSSYKSYENQGSDNMKINVQTF